MSNSSELARCKGVLAWFEKLDRSEAAEPLAPFIGDRMADRKNISVVSRHAAQRSNWIWRRQLMGPSLSRDVE